MLDRNGLWSASGKIRAQIWFASIRVNRSAATTGQQFVHTIGRATFGVSFHPVGEQMVMARDNQSHMMFTKERDVERPYRGRGRLYRIWRPLGQGYRTLRRSSSVRPRRKRRVVKERDDVTVARVIQMGQLVGHP